MLTRLPSILLLVVGLCFSGCATVSTIYNTRESGVANLYEPLSSEARASADVTLLRFKHLPCKGSIGVYRSYGLVHLGPCGPWKKRDYYGIYFKEGPEHPTKFYLTIAPDHSETRLVESKGTVELQDDDYVRIDVEYLDSNGDWTELPINGRRKIDLVLPERRRN